MTFSYQIPTYPAGNIKCYFQYKDHGKHHQIIPMYFFSAKSMTTKKPSYGIFSKTFDFIQDGKTIVEGTIGIHYIAKYYLVDLFCKIVREAYAEEDNKTALSQNKDAKNDKINELINEINTILSNLRTTDPTVTSNPILAILSSLTPEERKVITRLLNARNLYTVSGYTIDLNNTDIVPTRKTPFGIEHVDTSGLNMIVKFDGSSNETPMTNMYLYDLQFLQSSIQFSAADNGPILEIYNFIARI